MATSPSASSSAGSTPPPRRHSADAVEYDEMSTAAGVLRRAARMTRMAGVTDAEAVRNADTCDRVADMLDGQLSGPVEVAVIDALRSTGIYDEVDGEGDAASILAQHVRLLPSLVADAGTEEASNAAARVAEAFHEAYERLAPAYGYRTREASAVPWADVPEQNRQLMLAVVGDLLDRQVIGAGYPPGSCRGPDGSDLCARERFHPGDCAPPVRP